MKSLKDKYKGDTCWIVGKGPSLEFLDKKDFDHGPIITINHAVIPVEKLNLKNPVYSMQKDGGKRRNAVWRHKPLNVWYSPPCKFSGELCEDCLGIVMPKKATLLLHEHESKYCLPNYHDRIVFDFLKLGMPKNEFSLIVASYLAKYMGCSKIIFVACDAHAKADYREYDCYEKIANGSSEYYYFQTKILKQHLEDMPYNFITPGRKNENK